MPSEFVTAVVTMPVPLCFAETSAPGMTAPDGSTTVPPSGWVTPPCAKALPAITHSATVSNANTPVLNTLRFITRSILRDAYGTGLPSLRSQRTPESLDSGCIHAGSCGERRNYCRGSVLHNRSEAAQSRANSAPYNQGPGGVKNSVLDEGDTEIWTNAGGV